MTSLYLCYQSLLEPLTQTQVVAYLEGLAKNGYGIVLLTFEPRRLTKAETAEWRSRLKALGIDWHWLRYHKRPTVPATAYDIVVGIFCGWWLCKRYGVRLLHARVHVPGVMALVLKWLTRCKLVFDIRGFMAEEYVDAGVWPAGGRLFRACKRVERAVVRAADGFVVLTHAAACLLRDWYPDERGNKPLEVIPCCVDFARIPPLDEPADGPLNLVHLGKLGGWYLIDEMIDFVKAAVQVFPGLRWRVWTQSNQELIRRPAELAGLSNLLEVGFVKPDDLATELRSVHVGLSLIKPCLSKKSSSPTKVAEYLAAGLPVVSTAGIGDLDDHLTELGSPVGVLLRGFKVTDYQETAERLRDLLADPGIRTRCRAAAEAHYSLETVGWPAYIRLYAQLLGKKKA